MKTNKIKMYKVEDKTEQDIEPPFGSEQGKKMIEKEKTERDFLNRPYANGPFFRFSRLPSGRTVNQGDLVEFMAAVNHKKGTCR